MKLVEDHPRPVLNQPGTVKIIPEEPDDLWLAYNLITPGDIITAETTRKIHQSTGSETGKNGKNAFRVRVAIEIRITAVDYEKDSSVLRLKGKTTPDNEHVSSGVFHTLEIENNKQFDLKKINWNSDAIDVLREGCERTAGGADLVVVLMREGMAQLYAVGKSATTQRAKIEASVTNHKSSTNKFFENVFHSFMKHVDFSIVRCVVIGSNGSMKDEFRNYLLTESQKSKLKSVLQNKSRIFVVNTNTKNSLKEVLHDVNVMDMIKDTAASVEIKAFKEFSDTLRGNSDRACYGLKNVEVAQDMMAIDTLLITDDLFKSAEITTRKKYIELVKSVKKAGGKEHVFSPTHVCTEHLAQLTGIAAILRFPVPGIDDFEL